MKKEILSGTMFSMLFMSMLVLTLDVQSSVQGADGFRKVLIFEEDFESGIADWWNVVHGAPTLSTEVVHSGDYSYFMDEDYDALQYRWFDMSIIGEMEVWFYDNMSLNATCMVATSWEARRHFGALTWVGGNNEFCYAYRYSRAFGSSACPRSVGWHKVNIIHEPERAYILLDGNLLVEYDFPVPFRGFTIGDVWLSSYAGGISLTYIDDLKVWRYITVEAVVDAEPDTLSVRNKGKWITVYLQLPEEYNPQDIDATTILLNETIQPVLDPKYDFVIDSSKYLTDHNEDGILERMVKFDRIEAMEMLSVGETTLTITGETNGMLFEGSDTITMTGGS